MSIPTLYTMAQTATNTVTESARPASSWLSFETLLVIGIAIAIVYSLMMIYGHIKKSTRWSFSDALSEETETEIPLYQSDGATLEKDKNGEIVKVKQMRASSSRLIALLGTVAILILYVGAGLVVIRKFAADYTVPASTEQLGYFLLTGMVLFAPYIVNKFASIFGWLK